ncbi:hypothetical protein Lal_00025715 [Lupinus albus]|nr:hypothetical protein Lal_00025715 [Lupinus albus]
MPFLAQARQLSLKRESSSIAQDFTLPDNNFVSVSEHPVAENSAFEHFVSVHSEYSDFVHSVAFPDFDHSVHSKNMAQPPTPPGTRERTLRELAAPDFTYDSLSGDAIIVRGVHDVAANAARQDKLETIIDSLTSLITQLAINQQKSSMARAPDWIPPFDLECKIVVYDLGTVLSSYESSSFLPFCDIGVFIKTVPRSGARSSSQLAPELFLRKSAKEIWDASEIMHEGTTEDKRSMLNNTCSTSELENDEQVHLLLLVSHHSDDEEISEIKPFPSSELQLAFNELRDEYVKLRNIFLKQKTEL